MASKDQIVCVDNEVIEERVEMVKRQTTYTTEEANDALKKNNYDTRACIRAYLEVPVKHGHPQKISVNQQIYRELRNQLGTVSTPVYTPEGN